MALEVSYIEETLKKGDKQGLKKRGVVDDIVCGDLDFLPDNPAIANAKTEPALRRNSPKRVPINTTPTIPSPPPTNHPSWLHRTTAKLSSRLQQTSPISTQTQSRSLDKNLTSISPLPQQTMPSPTRCGSAYGN